MGRSDIRSCFFIIDPSRWIVLASCVQGFIEEALFPNTDPLIWRTSSRGAELRDSIIDNNFLSNCFYSQRYTVLKFF